MVRLIWQKKQRNGVSELKKALKHQSEAIAKGISLNDGICLWHECGLGKTFTSLSIYNHYKKLNPDLKALVACPLSLIEGAWRKEVEDFNFTLWNLNDSLYCKEQWDIIALNYESFVRSPKRLNVINEQIKKHQFIAILDESQNIKTHNSKTTKTFMSASSHFKHRIVMSGTPAPLDETDYWSQCNFVKPGIFGKNFFLFRNKYFHLTNGSNSIELRNPRDAAEWYRRGFKYKINPVMKEEFFRIMDTISHSADKKSCLDLPEKTFVNKYCYMDDEQKRQYRNMKEMMFAEINGEQVVASLALTKIMKLRQITSGFVKINSEAQRLKTNPKLELLKETMEEIGDKQVIIWAAFVDDIKHISEVLGDKCECIYGDVDKDYRPDILQRFREGKTKYLVAHPMTVGFGTTLVNCSYTIYYSLSNEGELYFQSQDRVHRIGQTEPCTYIHLLMKDTVDEAILNGLTGKWDSQKLLWEIKNKF